MKLELDSEEFAQWKIFYNYGKRGGVRSHEDEMMDIWLGRIYSCVLDANRTSGWSTELKDILLFPPEEHPDDIVIRQQVALAKMRGIIAILQRNKNTKG